MSYLSLIVALFGLAVSQELVFASDEVTTNAAATTRSSANVNFFPVYSVNGTSSTTGKPIVCIVAQFNAEFMLDFVTKNNKTGYGSYVIPDDAVVNKTKSYCNETLNVLQIDFKFGEASPGSNPYSHLKLVFAKSADQVFLWQISYAFHNMKSVFDSSKHDDFYGGLSNQALFQTSTGYSYYCHSPEALNFRGTLLTFTDLRVEAFRTEDNELFSKVDSCEVPNDRTQSQTIAIIIGSVVGVLVAVAIIVAVLYFLNKKYPFYNRLSSSVSHES